MKDDRAFATALCTRHSRRIPDAVEEICGLGIINKVFAVRYGVRRYILRYREDRAAYREYQKEQFCMEKACAAGIPGATVIGIGIYNNVPYMLQSFIAGVNGRSCPEKSEMIWKKLGEYAKMLHRVPVRGFGLDMTQAGLFTNSFSPTLEDHIAYNIASLSPEDALIRHNVYPAAQREKIIGMFEELKTVPWRLGLIHGDLSAKNTIVAGDTVSLIDYGCAFAGVVPYDEIIGMNECSECDRAAFYEGYGFLPGDWRGMRELTAYSVLQAFDKLRWALDKKPEDVDDYIRRAKNQYRKLSAIL